MRAKRTLLALALPFALLLPAACGGADEGGGDSGTLRILTNLPDSDSKGKQLTTIIANFQKANPGVKIEREDAPAPEEAHNRYEQAKLAGNEPDIVITNLFGKPTSWLDNGATVDVAKDAKDWGLESLFLPEALNAWRKPDGRLQGFPWEGFTWPVWYNLDLLNKAGVAKVPTTTDELIDATKKLRAAGIQPIVTGGKDWSGNKLFSLIVESMTTDEQALAAFRDGAWDTPEVKAGIELFTKLRDAGVFTDSAEGLTADQQRSTFGAGKAAIMHGGSWDYGSADIPTAKNANIELGGFPLAPSSTRQKPVIYTDFTATGVWISPKGQDKAATVEKFVKHLYTPESLGLLVEAGALAPVADDKVKVDKSTLPKLYVQASEKLKATTEVAVLSDVHVPTKSQTGFERATSLAFTPGTSADDIIKALKQAWQ
ncbi:multiple sugar transport system substrate-binding protein [Micromonospora rhizosphaerae]|uniref:Multiple sugar transport system substrate-binding protein n=1 Tax=Micromonospora rhizosphaerae TaxID=568872 RepID=A0A1C6T305_9ACTN|nr:extracellular solute-binding protein [Micromonospora rhizosphaerae]SCL36131.1 multiple sugar transport system substrate-binding protein [Micromonospora rhizosphaerae]